jgi:hypothetical protein
MGATGTFTLVDLSGDDVHVTSNDDDHIIGELAAERYFARLEREAEVERSQMLEYLNLEFSERWPAIPNDLPKIAEYILKLNRHFQSANNVDPTRTWRLCRSRSLTICRKINNLVQRNNIHLNEIMDRLQLEDQDNPGFDPLINPLMDLRTIVMDITTAEQGTTQPTPPQQQQQPPPRGAV